MGGLESREAINGESKLLNYDVFIETHLHERMMPRRSLNSKPAVFLDSNVSGTKIKIES